MPNDKEKLARFDKAIFAEVNEKAAAILAEVETHQKEVLEKAEEEAKNEAEKQAKQELEEIEAQYAQAITKEKLNAKQEVLLKRKELIEGLFEKAGRNTQSLFGKWGVREILIRCPPKSGPIQGKSFSQGSRLPIGSKIGARL